MMNRQLAALLAVVLAGPLAASQVTLQPDRDNTIYEVATGDTANGAGASIVAGRRNAATDSKRRALLHFDIASAIPAGSTVTGASLTLAMTQTSSGAQGMELRRLVSDWGEATSDAGASPGQGAPATAGDATWLFTLFNTTSWTTPGGDYAGTSSATLSVNGIGSYTWTDAQLTTDARDMLDNPASNFGWILIGNEAVAQTSKTFGSRENSTPANRPALVVDFTPPAGVADWSVFD